MEKKSNAVLILFLSVYFFLNVFIANAAEWVLNYEGVDNYRLNDLHPTNDGGFITCGMSYENGRPSENSTYIIKHNQNATIQWQKKYTGITAHRIQQTSSGGYIVVSASGGIMAIDDIGRLKWKKYIPNTNQVTKIEQTKDHGYIVYGTANIRNGDIKLIKLDQRGNILWQKAYGGEFNESDFVSGLHTRLDGGYIVVSTTQSFGSGESGAWIIKLNSKGDLKWQKVFYIKGNAIFPTWIQQSRDGGFIIGGKTNFPGNASWNLWVLKIDPRGDMQWQRSYVPEGSDGSGPCLCEDVVRSVQQTRDGGYIIAGYVAHRNTGGCPIASLIKINKIGDIKWHNAYKCCEANSVHEVDNGYIVGGNDTKGGRIFKIDVNGNIANCDIATPLKTTVYKIRQGETNTGSIAIVLNDLPQALNIEATNANANVRAKCHTPWRSGMLFP